MEKYGHAEWLYRRALEMVEKGFGPKGSEAAPFLNNFGTLYSAMGEYEKAQAHFQWAYDILSKAYRPNDPDVGICRRNLANAKAAAGQVPRPNGQRAVVI